MYEHSKNRKQVNSIEAMTQFFKKKPYEKKTEKYNKFNFSR